MMRNEHSFSWPYPHTPLDLVHIAMITLVLLLAGLVVTGFRYQAYKNFTLDSGTVLLSAQSLDSDSGAAELLLERAESGEVTNVYLQSYADQLANSVQSTTGYMASRQAKPSVQTQAQQLISDGQQLQQVLTSLSQPTDQATVRKAAVTISTLRQSIRQTEQAL